MVTNTEIHFMPVDECHTHALPRDTMHLRIVGQVYFYRRLLYVQYISSSRWSGSRVALSVNKRPFVTVFWKTDRMVTNTEIHFMPVDECHTHALPRDTMHLRIVGQVYFYRRLLYVQYISSSRWSGSRTN